MVGGDGNRWWVGVVIGGGWGGNRWWVGGVIGGGWGW